MKLLLKALAPAGRHGRLSIFIFHRVFAEADPFEPGVPDAAGFDRICAWLAAWFHVMPLADAARALAAGTLPERAAVITFDDGYRDNRLLAAPTLQRHGLTATFFVATDYLDGGCMWNDVLADAVKRCTQPVLDLRPLSTTTLAFDAHPLHGPAQRQALIDTLTLQVKYLPFAQRQALVHAVAAAAGVTPPTDLMMSSAEVREMVDMGMSIGAHTASHPILATLDRATAKREILQSKQALEAILGRPVTLFAYPNGKPGTDYLPESVDVVRECGFDVAVTTAWGAATTGADLLQLPRFTPWDRTRLKFGLRTAHNLLTARKAAPPAAREAAHA